MLDTPAIEVIAREVVRTRVADAEVERVLATQITDSEGQDALRVTVVLAPKAVSKLTGDAALDLLSGLQQRLQVAGEPRFAFIEYATEEEMRSDGEDDEPSGGS